MRTGFLLKLFAPVELDHTLICLAAVSDDTILANCGLNANVTAAVAAPDVMTGAIPTAAAFASKMMITRMSGIFEFIYFPLFLEDIVSHIGLSFTIFL